MSPSTQIIADPAAEPEDRLYWVVEADVPAAGEELWGLFCYEHGATGAEWLAERAGSCRLRHFFDGPPHDAETWPQRFRERYGGVPAPQGLEVRALPRADWQVHWREHFAPLPVGRRLVVTPPWAEAAARQAFPGRLPVVIDPGQGFGTGYHASTALALELLERTLSASPPPERMLDVGIGSGILAVAAARLGVARCSGVDTDPRVLYEVRRNFALNGLPPPEPLLCAPADGLREPAALVTANITAPVLLEMRQALRDVTAPGGTLILSGILAREQAEVAAAFAALGLAAVERAEREGWVARRFVRHR